MEFSNKTILLTGASTGIGKEMAKKFALLDCVLILISRRTGLINEYLNETDNKQADIHVIGCDVGSKDDVAGTMAKIKNEISDTIDILILNAGVSHRITPQEFNSAAAEETFGTNLFGIIYWVEQLLPGMMKRKEGMIVGVSSLADNRGYSGSGFYCASKAAATIFLEGLRVELKPYGIKVITIKPGFVKTPMNDKNEFHMPLLMEPEKAADIIICGIEKEKPVIAFPLPIVFISWFVGILPSRLYEYLAHICPK